MESIVNKIVYLYLFSFSFFVLYTDDQRPPHKIIDYQTFKTVLLKAFFPSHFLVSEPLTKEGSTESMQQKSPKHGHCVFLTVLNFFLFFLFFFFLLLLCCCCCWWCCCCCIFLYASYFKHTFLFCFAFCCCCKHNFHKHKTCLSGILNTRLVHNG